MESVLNIQRYPIFGGNYNILYTVLDTEFVFIGKLSVLKEYIHGSFFLRGHSNLML